MICATCTTRAQLETARFCASCGRAFPGAYDTPAVEYASFWSRAGALIIDYAVVSVPLFPILLYLFPPTPFERELVLRGPIFIPNSFLMMTMFGRLFGIMAITILVYFFYQIIMTASKHQGSVGKIKMRIKVVDQLNRPLPLAHAAFREICRLVSILPAHLGLFWPLIDNKKRQTFHDMIAGTYVVRRAAPQPPPAPTRVPVHK